MLIKEGGNSTFSIGINASSLFEETDYDYHGSWFDNFELRHISINQSIQTALNNENIFTFGGNLSSKNGLGTGNITTSLKHAFSNKTSGEMQVTVGDSSLLCYKTLRMYDHGAGFLAFNTLLHFGTNAIRPGIELSKYLAIKEYQIS